MTFEKSNFVKFEHSEKQKAGITSHFWFHVTDLSFLQIPKANSPIFLIFAPILMSVIEVDLKASDSISTTGMPSIVSGISIAVSAAPSCNPVIVISPFFSTYKKILSIFIPPFEFLHKKRVQST